MVFKVLKLEEITEHISVDRKERKSKHLVLRFMIFRCWEEEESITGG